MFFAVMQFIGAALCLTCGCFAFLGVPQFFNVSVIGGALKTLQLTLVPVMGLIMAGEGYFAWQARSALDKVVDSDVNDQAFLSNALNKMKFFFVLELAWVGVCILSMMLNLGVALVAPELAEPPNFTVDI